jgi:Na+/H+-translocating membrane pyrophosphatase
VLNELVVIYLAGWVMASVALYAASRRFSDAQTPAEHPLRVSLIAGAVWPLLVVGLVELSSVVVIAKLQFEAESWGRHLRLNAP